MALRSFANSFLFFSPTYFRTCLHKKCVRIFEHNFVADKAKIRRRAVARQKFLTQSAAKFAEKTCAYACEDRFSVYFSPDEQCSAVILSADMQQLLLLSFRKARRHRSQEYPLRHDFSAHSALPANTLRFHFHRYVSIILPYDL